MAIDSSIHNFLSQMKGDFARPNRYLVEFVLPPGINESGSYVNSAATRGNITAVEREINNEGLISMTCHTCNMPARTMMIYEHSQHSANFKVPISQQYEPVTFSFYNTKDMLQRRYFDVWQSAVVNINDNSLNYATEYTSTVKITQLDRKGERQYSVKLFGAWPFAVGEVEYGYGNNEAVTNTTVTISYKLWKAEHDDTTIYVWSDKAAS